MEKLDAQSSNQNIFDKLRNPELQQVPDYTSEALKRLKTEIQSVVHEVNRIFDVRKKVLSLEISSSWNKEWVPNEFECLAQFPMYTKVSLKHHTAPLILKFKFTDLQTGAHLSMSDAQVCLLPSSKVPTKDSYTKW